MTNRVAVEEVLRRRVGELISQAPHLLSSVNEAPGQPMSISSRREAWLASALSIIRVLNPDPLSVHRTRAEQAAITARSAYGDWRVDHVSAILAALLLDIDAGVVTSIREAAQAEVVDDYLELAEAYIDSGDAKHVGIAGSIASVVFEDSIKRACAKHDVITSVDAELEQRINALKAAGKLTKTRSQLAKGAAALRNQALHADWTFTADDVRHAIDITRTIIADLLGG